MGVLMGDPNWLERYFIDDLPAFANTGTGTLNDVATYSSDGLEKYIRFSGALPTVTGFKDGADGRTIRVVAAGGPLVLANEGATSSAANRITTDTGGDVTIPQNGVALLLYDATSSRWRIVGSIGSGVGGAIAGLTTPEAHGAIGDGITDDTAKITEAATDFTAGNTADEALELGARTYLVTGLSPWPMGFSIFGQGTHKTVLKSTTNAPILATYSTDATERQKPHTWAHFAVLGSGIGSGLTSQDGVHSGYLGGDGTSRGFWLGLYAKDIPGTAFLPAYSDKLGTGHVVAFLRAESCNEGLSGQEGENHGFQGIACTTGLRVSSGNHALIGGGFEGCTTAYLLVAGGNDAHGLLVGTTFTHNTTALNYAATGNGQYAIGIKIFDGAITIANGNTRFHYFSGSMIAGTTYALNGKTRWLNCTFGKQVGGYFVSADFTNGENEFINPRDEDGLIPPWIGQQYHCQISYADNSDKTLTTQQSWAELIEVAAGSETTTVNLFNTRTPSRGERQWIVNRCGHTVNYFWGTGNGIAIPTLKSALCGFDNAGTNMVCYALADNVASTASRTFDPATLALTGWWRASYSGSPWTGVASAGTSGGRDLTEATNPPTVGTAVNGLTPADGNGTSELIGSGLATSSFFAQNSMSGVALIYANVAGAINTPTAPYQENTIAGSQGNADWGVSITSVPSVRFWRQQTGATGYDQVSAALTTAAWHLVQWKYDGTNLKIRVDSGTWQSAASTANALSGTAQKVFFGYPGSAYFNGNILEIMFSDQVLADATFDSIKSYINTRYALSL